jgi:hypothetical protein
LATPGAARPGFAGPRKGRFGAAECDFPRSPALPACVRAARPSSGRPRRGRNVDGDRWCSDPLGEGVSATESGASRDIVGRPTPTRGSVSPRRSGWRPPPDATEPEAGGRYGAPRVVATGSARSVAGHGSRSSWNTSPGGRHTRKARQRDGSPSSDTRIVRGRHGSQIVWGSEKLPTTHLHADYETAPGRKLSVAGTLWGLAGFDFRALPRGP